MSRLYLSTIFWWPAILRLFIFSTMTAGGAFLAQLEGKKTGDFANYGWVEWNSFAWPIFLTWLGTILAFLDQTMGRLREKGEGETAFLTKRRREIENQARVEAQMRADS